MLGHNNTRRVRNILYAIDFPGHSANDAKPPDIGVVPDNCSRIAPLERKQPQKDDWTAHKERYKDLPNPEYGTSKG